MDSLFLLEITNEATDQYVCPDGKALKLNTKRMKNKATQYRRYFADPKDCQACASRLRCLTAQGGRRKNLCVPIGPDGVNLSKQMAAKIDTDQGRSLYAERMRIVKPIFGNIRIHKGLDRFTLHREDHEIRSRVCALAGGIRRDSSRKEAPQKNTHIYSDSHTRGKLQEKELV